MEQKQNIEKQEEPASRVQRTTPTTLQIVDLLNDPLTTAGKISKVINSDNALMGKILRIANSPILGFPGRVSSVNYAIVLMGFDALRFLMTRLMIGDALRKLVDTFFNYQGFWNHSIGSGVVAKLLSAKYSTINPDDAFICGLLHDVGYLALHEKFKENLGNNLKKVHLKNIKMMPLEEIIGISHEDAGSDRVAGWELPFRIIEAVKYHHKPQLAAEDPVLTSIVHVADVLCTRMDLGLEEFERNLNFDNYAMSVLNLSEEMLSQQNLQGTLPSIHQNIGQLPSFQGLIDAVKQELVNAIADLPEQEKIIVALHYYEGLSMDEISKVMNLDEPQVEILHTKALTCLQLILQRKV